MKSFALLLSLLLLKLFLATSQLIVVVDVATLALAFGVDQSLASMRTVSRHITPSILVIAVIAHAHGIEWEIGVRAGGDLTLLSA